MTEACCAAVVVTVALVLVLAVLGAGTTVIVALEAWFLPSGDLAVGVGAWESGDLGILTHEPGLTGREIVT